MTASELKRKLRALKRFEISLRGLEPSGQTSTKLVWDRYFSTNDSATVRYPFMTLSVLDRPSRKRIIVEYLEAVVLAAFGFQLGSTAPARRELTHFLGIPAEADSDTVRKRFREVAHELHPDHGGDTGVMAELLRLYHDAG